MLKTLLLSTSFFLISLGLFADAAVKIDAPTFRGVSLDWCKDWGGTDCGKHAADAFCKEKNFAEAISFEIAKNIGYTRLFTSGDICKGESCDGFKFISCRKLTETYEMPRYNDYHLDWCGSYGTNCGKYTADKFCTLKGFREAYAFVIMSGIGRTMLIENKEICNGDLCDGFAYIKCRN